MLFSSKLIINIILRNKNLQLFAINNSRFTSVNLFYYFSCNGYDGIKGWSAARITKTTTGKATSSSKVIISKLL